MEEIRNQIIEKEREIKIKDDEIEMLNKQLQSRVKDVEKKNETMKENISELKLENESFKAMINTVMEKADTVEKNNVEMKEELSNLREENNSIRAMLQSTMNVGFMAVSGESETDESTSAQNKCAKCDFVGKNQAGLKIQETAKHKEKPLLQRFSRVGNN